MDELSYSQKIASFYVNADINAIPERVFEHTKNVIVDWAGCGIGGANIDSTKMVKNVFLSEQGSHDCTVFCGQKASVDHAAFINGAASHGLEMDDASYDAGGHPAVVILPAAMAMAETVNAKGKDFLLSVIWGYDMMTRVGRGVVPDKLFRTRLAPRQLSGGIFGAAAAAAWLLKLDAGQTANALGIAGGFASGNLECYADGSLTKRLQSGQRSHGRHQRGAPGGRGLHGTQMGFSRGSTASSGPIRTTPHRSVCWSTWTTPNTRLKLPPSNPTRAVATITHPSIPF